MRFPVFNIGMKKWEPGDPNKPCPGDCCNGALWVTLTFRRMSQDGEQLYQDSNCALKFIIEQMQGMADKEVKLQAQVNKDITENIGPRITEGLQAVAASMEKAVTKVLGEQVKQIGKG
jgi:hypothetical protein